MNTASAGTIPYGGLFAEDAAHRFLAKMMAFGANKLWAHQEEPGGPVAVLVGPPWRMTAFLHPGGEITFPNPQLEWV